MERQSLHTHTHTHTHNHTVTVTGCKVKKNPNQLKVKYIENWQLPKIFLKYIFLSH